VLVTRAVYRLTDDQRGRVTFQLNGNGYRFAPGHAPRLQLLGRDAPAYRASNGSFSVKVSRLRVELPVAERPGSVPGVGSAGGRKRTISTRRPFVRHKTCTFSSKVRFRHKRRFGKAKRLTVRVRYGGNAVLTPAKARVRRVRIRR
jgi:hypothetical protein